jgi:hypothetical protein
MVSNPKTNCDFRILTAHHNEIELGRRKCTEPIMSSNIQRQGSEHGTPQLASLCLADSVKSLHDSLFTNQLSGLRAYMSSEETMASIGGQQKVTVVPDIIERAKTMIQYQKESEARKRMHGMQSSPPPKATAELDNHKYPRMQTLEDAMPAFSARASPARLSWRDVGAVLTRSRVSES